MFAFIAGMMGAICVVLAFFLLTHKTITSHSKAYLWLNLIGASLVGIETYSAGSLAAFMLNVVWIAISLYGLVHARKR